MLISKYNRINLALLFAVVLSILFAWNFVRNSTIFRYIKNPLLPRLIPADIVYMNNTSIPRPPNGKTWPEEIFLLDRDITDIRVLADAWFSNIRLEGKPEVRLGDTITVTVTLYDGHNRRKQRGGDLVRVWMREQSSGSSSNGNVVDNGDGSYTATLIAFWVGQPEIVAAIISPREVISFAMKRRYVLPYVLMNTATFTRNEGVIEETPCNYDPQVPGYDVICNLTSENFGLPWYCGKPRSDHLSCSDWTFVADQNLWQSDIEQQRLSPLELELLSVKRKAMLLASRVKINVTGVQNQTILLPVTSCNKISRSQMWISDSPVGYFHRRKWYSRICRRDDTFSETLKKCLQNTKILTVGDSTVRQIFQSLKSMMPCNITTNGDFKTHKHQPIVCFNYEHNFNLTFVLHQLPFCTKNGPHNTFKPLREYSSEVRVNTGERTRTIVVITLFSHFLNMHSHVFYENAKRLRQDILNLLEENPNLIVVIKGPHAYSFAKNPDAVLWMPDIYANIYQNYLYEIFRDIHDRVIYINTLDMTISSEQWHIHSEDYIIREQVLNMLGYIC